MDFTVTNQELSALCGLPHLQQLLYLRGVRPYMDNRSNIVGVKRGISYQSLAEECYVESHQGIRGGSPSKDQLRRALKGLERAGVIEIHSTKDRLVLKCLIAKQYFNSQNKAATKAPSLATTAEIAQPLDITSEELAKSLKATTLESRKATIPQKENNYIYLLQRFDSFWLKYPEKKSRDRAFEMFQQINPDESLLQTMLKALDDQIRNRNQRQDNGEWVPAWKYPANWLAQKCWEDEIKIERTQEKRNAKRGSNTERNTDDPFWCPELTDETETITAEPDAANVINLHRYR